MRAALLAVVLTGCTVAPEQVAAPADDVPCDGVDLRQSYDVRYPDGLQIVTPTLVIPAGSEVLWCFYGTWEGEDAGIVGFQRRAPEQHLHHLNIKTVADDDPHADGELVDCTSIEEQATHGTDLIAESGGGLGADELDLPEGVALGLNAGTRWVTDVHYINTSNEPICVNAAYDFDLVPADEVDAMAAAVELDVGHFEIPPGPEVTLRTECTLPADLEILSMVGHMHERGRRHRVELLQDGQATELYQVDPWLPHYQYDAPIETFALGEVQAAEGDVLAMDCTWENETGGVLGYPDEMCQTQAVAWPLDGPIQCEGGSWDDGGGPGDDGLVGDGDGVLTGTVRRGDELLGDGRGELLVAAFRQGEWDPIAARMLGEVDLSDPETRIDYALQGLPVGETVRVFAMLDDDGTGRKTGPTAQDLRTEVEVLVEAEPGELDLVLRAGR